MTDPVPSNETLSELFEYVVSLSHDMDVYHSQMLMQVAGVIGGVIASRAPPSEPVPSKDLLPEVSLTLEQEARADQLYQAILDGWKGRAARLVVYLQDLGEQRATEIGNLNDHIAKLIRENDQLRTALRGIQSCSTCEACRGAATLALGGVKSKPAHEREPPHCSSCSCGMGNPLEKVACCFAGKVKDSYILKLWFESQEDLDAAFNLIDEAGAMLPMVPMDNSTPPPPVVRPEEC